VRLIRICLAITAVAVATHSSVDGLGTLTLPWESNRFTTSLGGGGYMEAKAAPALAPATLFAAVALGAIIALIIKNEKDHGHTSAHVHSH
jgi:hypothetical protein